ncbi:patatin-like phospholipase family protein [Acidovorax sp. SUPP3334]|uniref:patatin-like phospholipase family protein n=1 Tax=Acidovorax sp. SUPP3334 TaxID=2920881 RepID=UPI0024E0E9A8|nr:patatin-like phospholipase family protein [Acidovorax sp. SUPP3334]
MKALRIHAGPLAREHIVRHGLRPADIGVVPAAAGGPKGLILGPLDRFVFGQWLQGSQQPVHLVGASIGAWRMATACLDTPVAALERLEHAYIHQNYAPPPGRKRPSAAQVSEQFGQGLRDFFGAQVPQLLSHPRWRLHIVASRGRHLLSREHRWATPLGYLVAFAANAVRRRALGLWLERVVFSGPASAFASAGVPAPAPLPFTTDDFPTRQVALTEANFMPALQASCSIPFVLQAVHDIPGAPPGAYWDGGLTDYHLHLRYRTLDAIENIAIPPSVDCAGGQNHSNAPGALVLYPHFQQNVVPGWLDKGLRWRHGPTSALDRMVVLSPHPDWVRTLPNAKLPDRNDFMHYGTDLAARVRAWSTATAAARQLADEFAEWLHRPDPGAVQPL